MGRKEEQLFTIDINRDVEWQVDAMFAPAFSLIAERHHSLLERLERDMINALKGAMRLPATAPLPISGPHNWPAGSGERLLRFRRDEEMRAARPEEDRN
jgi:hypothetical protein